MFAFVWSDFEVQNKRLSIYLPSDNHLSIPLISDKSNNWKYYVGQKITKQSIRFVLFPIYY